MFVPPPQFPPLPEPTSGQWSPNVRDAHETLAAIYEHAVRVFSQEDSDPTRIAYHIDALSSHGLSLLQALEAESDLNDDQYVPDDWLRDTGLLLGELVGNMHLLKEAATGQCVLIVVTQL